MPPRFALGRADVSTLGILWLSGIALRVTMLAVPPLLPDIHQSIRLSETGVGLLTTLPLLLFSVASVPGAWIISKMGARTALIGGLSFIAGFGALRGAYPAAHWLFLCTILMGTGIAVVQPTMPALVKNWFPERIGLATAVYTNGLLVGQTLGAGITRPLFLDDMHQTWQAALAIWSVPVALTLMVAMAKAPRGDSARPGTSWWPDWSSKRPWHLGLLLGFGSSVYYACNTFVPELLRITDDSKLIVPCLTAMSLCQTPAPLLVAFGSSRIFGKSWPIAANALVGLLALTLLITTRSWLTVAAAGVVGFTAAFNLTLCLSLPSILVPQSDVPRLSAAMFAIGYACSVCVPIIGGAIWDATSTPLGAFVPCYVAYVTVLALGLFSDALFVGDAASDGSQAPLTVLAATSASTSDSVKPSS